jgi:hypothetical protein
MTGSEPTPAVDAAMRVVEPEQLALFDDPPPPVTDDEEAEDLAAEMDDAVPADTDGAEDYPPTEPPLGVCRGGPYNGRTVASRFPEGFLLFDKARARMWRYIRSVERPGEYVCLATDPVSLTDADILGQAAEGSKLDVLAYDEGPGVT